MVRLGVDLFEVAEVWFSDFGDKCLVVFRDACDGRRYDIPSQVAMAIYHVNDVLVKGRMGIESRRNVESGMRRRRSQVNSRAPTDNIYNYLQLNPGGEHRHGKAGGWAAELDSTLQHAA